MQRNSLLACKLGFRFNERGRSNIFNSKVQGNLRDTDLYLLPAGDASSISLGVVPQRLNRVLSLNGMRIELLVPPEDLKNWQEIITVYILPTHIF